MTNINIYENSKGELDLTKIQNTLNEILKENRELNNRLSKIEDKLKYLNNNEVNAKKNKETITKALKEIGKPKEDNIHINTEVDTETELDYSNHNLTDFQIKVLNSIPIVDNPQEYEKEMMKTYSSMKPSDRKTFIEQQCTISSLSKKFDVNRNVIVGNIFTNSKPRHDLFRAFKINPHNMKSTQVLYRERAVPELSKKRGGRSKKDNNALWEISVESAKENYHNLRLKPHFGLKYDSRDGKRTYDLYYDMFDIFYIKSLLSSKFTNKDFNDLLRNYNKHNWTVKNLSQIIYNIQNNIDLQKLIVDTRKFFNTGNTFSENNGILRINDVNTHIRVEQARDWCMAYMNNGKSKDDFIWNLQRRFPEIKREFITMIIYNHNNKELYELWKEEEKPPFIENNPSKRKNLIRNGGII